MASTTVLGLSLTLTPPLLTALRLAPLLGTTASLTHAYMEWATNSSFLRPPPMNSRLTLSAQKLSSPPIHPDPAARKEEVDRAKDVVIPIWFTNFFDTCVWSVIGFNSITLYSALANIFLFPTGLGEHRRVYVAGLVAALGHYVFAPGVTRSVDALYKLCIKQEKGQQIGEEEKGKAEDWVRQWVGVHTFRMCTVDLISWGCFAFGAVRLLSQNVS